MSRGEMMRIRAFGIVPFLSRTSPVPGILLPLAGSISELSRYSPITIFPSHETSHAVHSISSNFPEQLYRVVRRFWCIGSFILVTYLMPLSCFHEDFIVNSYYPAIFPHFPAITPRFLPFLGYSGMFHFIIPPYFPFCFSGSQSVSFLSRDCPRSEARGFHAVHCTLSRPLEVYILALVYSVSLSLISWEVLCSI